MAAAQHSQEHLLAALALSDLANHAVQARLETDDDLSPSSGPDAESTLETEAPARLLSELPGTSDQWPCAPGKGWFAKSQRGGEVHFLERIFLMLSFGSLRLRAEPSRALRDTIRWLSPESAARLGVPRGVWAFEIVCVELFEREVYPQYASGSFNKTAAKWCLISPPAVSAAGSAVDAATGGGAPARKLSRHCMYLPRSWVVDGVEHAVDAQGAFRPLDEDLPAAQVNEYAARHVRALQEHAVRHVYRLREESERRRKLGLAQPASHTPPPPPPPPLEAARRASPTGGSGSASSGESELRQLAAGRAAEPQEHLHRRLNEWRAACAAEGGRPLVPARRAADAREKGLPGELTPPPGPVAEADKHAFLTPNPQRSPLAERTVLSLAPLPHVDAPAPLAPSTESLARAHADGVAYAGRADTDGGYHSRTASDGPGSDETHARMSAGAAAAESTGLAAESDDAGQAVGSAGAPGTAGGWAPPAWATGASGARTAHTPFVPLGSSSPEDESGSKPGSARAPRSVRDGALALAPARPHRQDSDLSLGTAAAAAVAELSLGGGAAAAGARSSSPSARGAAVPVAPQRAFSEGGALADAAAGPATSHVFPYAPGKGWFAFNRSGKSIYFLERLFRMLSSPHLPLRKHPRAVLGDVIRWMAPAQAQVHGVPAGIAPFEIINTELFEDEVYPQFKSGSFRKTAKHWCILSPQPNTAVQQKLSVKCMFIPADKLSDSGAHEPVDCFGCFRALGPHSTEEDVEQYIQDHIRPLEERVRGALLSAAASSRERERAAGARDLLPPEKRHKGAAGGGRRPPLHHQRSSHL